MGRILMTDFKPFEKWWKEYLPTHNVEWYEEEVAKDAWEAGRLWNQREGGSHKIEVKCPTHVQWFRRGEAAALERIEAVIQKGWSIQWFKTTQRAYVYNRLDGTEVIEETFKAALEKAEKENG
jgi:hypothetical protein